MSLQRNFLLKYILGSNSFNTNKKIYDECDILLTKNKWSCFMLKRRELIENGRDSLPVCDDSDSDILVFDFVHNMTGYNFVRFHFDGLLVSEDEREDVAEPKVFADLMLFKPAERGFKMKSCEFLPGSDGDVLTFNALTSYSKSHNCGHAKGES